MQFVYMYSKMLMAFWNQFYEQRVLLLYLCTYIHTYISVLILTTYFERAGCTPGVDNDHSQEMAKGCIGD